MDEKTWGVAEVSLSELKTAPAPLNRASRPELKNRRT
jgi:hypothetical protein